MCGYIHHQLSSSPCHPNSNDGCAVYANTAFNVYNGTQLYTKQWDHTVQFCDVCQITSHYWTKREKHRFIVTFDSRLLTFSSLATSSVSIPVFNLWSSWSVERSHTVVAIMYLCMQYHNMTMCLQSVIFYPI